MKKLILIISFLAIFPGVASAANLSNWGATLTDVAKPAGYNLGTNTDFVLQTILKTVFSLLGVFFLCLMIYGGFLWMTDRGNSDQVEKAKKLITAAIIGMIIVLASYAISYFVLNAISSTALKETSTETP